MTRLTQLDFVDDDRVQPDLALITDYLANELPEEQVAEVRRRLETDSAFRDLAAPLIAAWTIPPHWARHPMPRETVEKRWDQLTRRAGFVHQRQKTRRSWTRLIFGIALAVALVIGANFVLGLWDDSVSLRYYVPTFDSTGAELVTDSGHVMQLGDGTRVWLDSGARLEVPPSVGRDHNRAVRLTGGARFQVVSRDTVNPIRGGEFKVFTYAGIVTSWDAEFRVRAIGDTTEVIVTGPHRVPPRAGTPVLLESLPVRALGEPLMPEQGARAIHDRGITRLDSRIRDSISAEQRRTKAPPRFSNPRLSRRMADSGHTMRLASGVLVTLVPGARAYAIPDSQMGRGRVIALEGSASIVVPTLPPIGGYKATAFVILTRGGMITAANAAAFKISARGDTTDVEVLPLPPNPMTGAPPASPGVVMLEALRPGPRSTNLVVAPGLTGRITRGYNPVVLKVSP